MTQLVGARAAERLLPFQARLTDAQGSPIPDGPTVVRFQIFRSASDADLVWNGEIHQTTVNGGLINVVLGTKATLSHVDFGATLYLEITSDVDGDRSITDRDPPLRPRQTILPAPFAAESADSRKLAGHDWGLLFGGGDPAEGRIASARLANQVVDALVPPGSVLSYAGNAETLPPRGWLLCDGRSLKSADYPRLYAAVGIRWGDGSTGVNGEPTPGNDFNLPDLRGMFLRGRSAGSFTDPDADSRGVNRAGGVSGNLVGSVQGDELRRHDHPMPGTRRDNYQIGGSVHGDDVSNDGFTFKLYTEPRGGAETRPKNASVDFIIKH